MAEFDSLLAGSIAATQRRQRQVLRWDVVMVALATFGLGIGWWYVLLIARRRQVGLERGNEQLRRQGALLEEANLDLDQKVAQRTVELSAKNVTLSTQQENSPDAVLVVDENARIASFNGKFVTLFGIPEDLVRAGEDEPVLRHVVTQMRDPDAFLAKVHYIYEHKEESSRDEIETKNGRIIDRFSSGMMGANGEYYGRVWYFHDITVRRQAEAALAAATAKLQAVMDAATQISIVATDTQGSLRFSIPAPRGCWATVPRK
jgi:PAS domain S-box-containing protein